MIGDLDRLFFATDHVFVERDQLNKIELKPALITNQISGLVRVGHPGHGGSIFGNFTDRHKYAFSGELRFEAFDLLMGY